MVTIPAAMLRQQSMATRLGDLITDEMLKNYLVMFPDSTTYFSDGFIINNSQEKEVFMSVREAYEERLRALGYKVESKFLPKPKRATSGEMLDRYVYVVSISW